MPRISARTQAVADHWKAYWDAWWASARNAKFPSTPRWRRLTFTYLEPQLPPLRSFSVIELEVTCLPEEVEPLQSAFALGGIEAVRAVLARATET